MVRRMDDHVMGEVEASKARRCGYVCTGETEWMRRKILNTRKVRELIMMTMVASDYVTTTSYDYWRLQKNEERPTNQSKKSADSPVHPA
jgi:hypothetical protein